MSIIFTNLNREVTLKKVYEGSEKFEGLVIVKIIEKSLINRTREDLFIDVSSFANALNISEIELLELISYSPAVKGYLAYYRDKQYKAIKILEIKGLKDLTRMLRGLGTDMKLLKETIWKIDEMLNIIEEKESETNGKN
ncbi:hypothetical protein [Neobacillus mesonae]|uniref:hypothetical protein n=1 Tax=Neobacillus mesonae TaxID=1193713 RepID=UPI0025743987|nr:hypothetical protein [Neobacillus mesonae]